MQTVHRYGVAVLSAATLAFGAAKAEDAVAKQPAPIPAPAVNAEPDHVSITGSKLTKAFHRWEKDRRALSEPWYGDSSDSLDAYKECPDLTNTVSYTPIEIRYKRSKPQVRAEFEAGGTNYNYCGFAGTYTDSSRVEVKRPGSNKYRQVGKTFEHTAGLRQLMGMYISGPNDRAQYLETRAIFKNIGELCNGRNASRTRMRVKVTNRFTSNPAQTFQHENRDPNGRSDNVPSSTETHYSKSFRVCVRPRNW
jgi:hypothetical protein